MVGDWGISAEGAGKAAGHEALDLGEGCHGGVAGGGHGEGAVGDAAVEGPGELAAGEEAVEEAGGEGVATADAVEDVEVGEGEAGDGLAGRGGLVGDSKGGPAIAVGGVGAADGGGEDFEVGILGEDAAGHGCEGVEGVPGGAVGIVAEGCGEVAFVAEEDVDEGEDGAVHFDGTLTASAGGPEGGAIVGVVAYEGAVAAGGGDGFANELGGVFGERGHDAAGVEDADAFGAEDGVPVDGAGLELGDGGMATVHHAEAGADAEAALEEVDAVAGVAAYAVEGLPVDVGGVDAALEDEVFDEASYGVVDQGGGDGGAEIEAAAETAGDVVLAAALPDAEVARADDAAFAGIEAQHDFAEGEEVPAAVGGGAEREGGR